MPTPEPTIWDPDFRYTEHQERLTSETNSEEITQAELRRFRELRDLKRQADALRRSIRNRLLAGARIEHGPLVARLITQEQRRFTERRLQEFWGQDYVAELKRYVPPTTVHYLMIENATSDVE